ncbi:MAG TPA: imidazole glycerol phosphate synthase subunit HisH [Terriglobales bacterium]|nr:imidazole glycerol phosphate synthase subunit HisH [Terriglobales bacterium]
MKTIAVVDYGAGNPVSVKKALDWLGQTCVITADPSVVESAHRIVLPGVGHFASTETLRRTGLENAITAAIARGTPFLGICVGMQWMYAGSEEAPRIFGLGIFNGACERFPREVKSPHVGWNQLELSNGSRLFQGVPSNSFAYFSHSFRVPVTPETTAGCDYGGRFSAAVERGHLFGVQFHPEKSGDLGLSVLRNFCAI